MWLAGTGAARKACAGGAATVSSLQMLHVLEMISEKSEFSSYNVALRCCKLITVRYNFHLRMWQQSTVLKARCCRYDCFF